MEFKNIRYEEKEQIGILTLNRPEVLNAFNKAAFKELSSFLDMIIEKAAVRGLIITGEGRAFAAGADLSEIKNDGGEENRTYAALAQSVFNRIEALPFPVIGAVNGFALGGGFELALACDIRIAGEDAKFGLPETSLGVIPCFGGTQRLQRLTGAGIAKELIFTGRKVKASEALSLGIVNKIVPQEELLDAAMAMMQEIVKNSPTALKYAKLAVNQGGNMALAEALELEMTLSAFCYELSDKKEGMRAFEEKRRPVYPANSDILGGE